MDKKQNAKKWYPTLAPLLEKLPDLNNPHWDQLYEAKFFIALEQLLDQHTHTKNSETNRPF